MSKTAIVLLFSVALLFSLGLLMVFNTTAAEIIDRSLDVDTHTALYKQVLYGIFGIGLGFLAHQIGYEKLLRWSPVLSVIITLFLLSLFIPGAAQTINGAKRWVNIFGFSFQPSECAKIIIPSLFIHWLSKQSHPISWHRFLQILGLMAIPIGLILLEPDNGTTAIILCLLVILFLLAKIPFRYWVLPLLCLIALGGAAAFHMPHVHQRIQIYLHPELDLRGKGHQPHQAKIAAGSGGLLGRGLGESLQKLNYLPEARSDYIAAIYAEETGFIGMLLLIGLYAGVAYSGCFIALKTKEQKAFLLASVLTFLISIQAFLNLGIVSGILPSKGMTLPFFSQGGSSLIVNVAAVFLLLDISRKSGRVLAGKRR